MNKFAFILSILLTSSVFAGDCGPNCYQGDINGDGKADKLEFVIGERSRDNPAVAALKLKVTRSGTTTLIKAHDKYQKDTTTSEYITMTDSADIGQEFRMSVMEGSRLVQLQWHEKEGHFGVATYRILPNGKLVRDSQNGE
ncbi:MAG: hypothetical protein R2877_03905 [Bdellovibrionota bacterium]